mgnify:FL=1
MHSVLDFQMRRFSLNILALAVSAAAITLLCSASPEKGPAPQSSKGDAFIPIAKYIQKGDHERLSAWFAENLEVEIFGIKNECSRIQATMIMKNFFSQHPPKSFKIIHKSGNPPMKYAIGNLSTGSENLRVVLLVRTNPGTPQILRIRIEKAS